MAILSKLFPCLSDSNTPIPQFIPDTNLGAALSNQANQDTDTAERLDLASALHELLAGLAQAQPHLLLLDDAQAADAHFWQLLRVLAPYIESQRLLIVLSYQGDVVRANPVAWQTLRDLDCEQTLFRVALGGLSAAECVELSQGFDVELDNMAANALCQQTSGNPLLIREWLLAPASQSPTLIRDLFARRLAVLPKEIYIALQAAAILGQAFSHTAWQKLTGTSAAHFTALLISNGILSETENGYAFRYGSLYEYIYESVPLNERRILARRARSILACESPMSAMPIQPAGTIAYVYSAEDLASSTSDASDTTQCSTSDTSGTGLLCISLARAEAPLGKPLTDAERITIRWTIDAGGSDAMLRERSGKVVLRRHRIVRLIAEAQTQGAAATDADLARALGVTQRTIEADMAAIRAAGQSIPTRRRMQAG
jgi:hypothetical protein